MKSIEEFQQEVDKWTSQFDPQYWTPHEIMTRFIEEGGELAREVNHHFGPKRKKRGEPDQRLGDEIADIFFTLTCLANSQGIDLFPLRETKRVSNPLSWKRRIFRFEGFQPVLSMNPRAFSPRSFNRTSGESLA